MLVQIGVLCIFGQTTANTVELLPDIVGRLSKVGPPVEIHGDVGAVLIRGGSDFFDIVDGADGCGDGSRQVVFSIVSVISRSTSCGPAPSYSVMTVMDGKVMSGKMSMGSRRKEMDPKIRTARKNIAVVIGLRTAKCERFISFLVSG